MVPAQQQNNTNMVLAQGVTPSMVPAQGAVRITPAQQQGAPIMVPAQPKGPSQMVQAHQATPAMIPAQGSHHSGMIPSTSNVPSMVPSQGRVNMGPAQGSVDKIANGSPAQQQQQLAERPGPSPAAPGPSSFQKPGGGPMQAAGASTASQLQNAGLVLAQMILNSQQAAAGMASLRNMAAGGSLGQLGRPGGPGFPHSMPGGAAGMPRPMMMMPPKRRYPPDDERRIMPRRGLDYALKAAGLESKFKLGMSTEAVLGELYEEVIGNAISFGCSNAKRRKSSTLKPRDMAVYLERTWNLYVPGYGADQLRPYRRAVASKLHEARQRAARQLAAGAEASEDGAEMGKK
jgi:transcription initiation factor TFIID subunit 12